MQFAEILLRRGLLKPHQLEQVQASHGDDRNLLEAASDLGFLNPAEALQAIGEEVGVDYLDLNSVEVDLSLLKQFPLRLIHRVGLFPISRENGQITVATSDPFDLYPLDEVGAATGLSVHPVLAERKEIGKLIKRHLGVGSETVDSLIAAADDDEIELLDEIQLDNSELSEMAQEAGVVKLVNEILLEAIESRASDVHVESQSEGLVVRYRVDGILHTQPMPPEIHRFEAAIVSRLKIMARLNIAEKRLPQDGRIKIRVSGREIDIRVSVIPMIHGEGLVMRILDKGNLSFDLRKLGMAGEVYDVFHDLIRLPHGIILVTGPTGSGKTTTLYSSLLEINTPDNKIITTEDPVEYQLAGINQIQVHSKIGLTFAASLRSILRHDPDVVLVGEIRDLETAENAIQAALTGHLVFSTLHTNDAASAYARLIDMGVEPFLVASTVEAVMAQRLVRRLCPNCKEPFEPTEASMPRDFPWDKLNGRPMYRQVGCRECRGLGYSGRLGIYELMVTTEKVQALAHDRASTWDIQRAALKDGMDTLRTDGWRKAMDGHTSVDEVLRVTKSDRVFEDRV
ncbi:MAG: Flp pilus assembly complex ATPase component TadA [Planctomycetales bacterium]|nr:Flp pilus assembly complex ATPase component TadA [Planctomycetales bacterium]